MAYAPKKKRMNTLDKMASIIAAVSGLASAVFLLMGKFQELGPALILFFLTLAYAIRKNRIFGGFSFRRKAKLFLWRWHLLWLFLHVFIFLFG